MPNIDPISKEAKVQFISYVQAAPFPGGPREAGRLQDILNNYTDIVTAISRQLSLYASNSAYLTQCMSVFDDTKLIAVGIFNNKVSNSPPLSNPVMIINSSYSDIAYITASSPPIRQILYMLNSSVSNVVIETGATLSYLYIGPSSVVDSLDSSAAGASVGTVQLPFIKSQPSALNVAVYGSTINNIQVDDGSYFGGYSLVNSESVCGSPVNNFKYGIITHSIIQLTWEPPDQQSPPLPYLFININFRIKGSNTWIGADTTAGDFNGNAGFTFTNLNCDTTYEFMVSVTCVNGGVANSSILTVATTAAAC